MARTKSEELFAFPAQGWFEREGQRRALGKTIRYRIAVQIGKHGYSAGVLTEGSLAMNPARHCGCIKHLWICFHGLDCGHDVPWTEFLRIANEALAGVCGKRFELPAGELTLADYDRLAGEMDSFYECDYARHDGVRARLTGEQGEDGDEEEDAA